MPKTVALLQLRHAAWHHGDMNQQTRGVPGRFFPHAIEDEQTRIRIAQRAQAGESVSALAEEYGVSTRTVHRYRDALSGGED